MWVSTAPRDNPILKGLRAVFNDAFKDEVGLDRGRETLRAVLNQDIPLAKPDFFCAHDKRAPFAEKTFALFEEAFPP